MSILSRSFHDAFWVLFFHFFVIHFHGVNPLLNDLDPRTCILSRTMKKPIALPLHILCVYVLDEALKVLALRCCGA